MESTRLEVIGERYGAEELREQRDDIAFLRVPKDRLVDLLQYLRDVEQYSHLVFFTAVDLIERDSFRLVYMLHNYESRHDIGVEVDIPRENASMESIHRLWAQAATYQRELKEMFGIDFPGSPGVDDPFILEGWDEIPPMRRDFDTKAYSESTYVERPGRYTVDTREHMKQGLYPEPEGEGA